MSLGERFRSFGVKFFDEFVKDGFASLITVDFDEQAESLIVLEYW